MSIIQFFIGMDDSYTFEQASSHFNICSAYLKDPEGMKQKIEDGYASTSQGDDAILYLCSHHPIFILLEIHYNSDLTMTFYQTPFYSIFFMSSWNTTASSRHQPSVSAKQH